MSDLQKEEDQGRHTLAFAQAARLTVDSATRLSQNARSANVLEFLATSYLLLKGNPVLPLTKISANRERESRGDDHEAIGQSCLVRDRIHPHLKDDLFREQSLPTRRQALHRASM